MWAHNESVSASFIWNCHTYYGRIVLNIIEIGCILQQGRTQRPGAICILNLAISDVVVGLTMVILKSIDSFMETDLKYDMTAQEI